MRRQSTRSRATEVMGYPADGDVNYAGLFSFACSDGYCPIHNCTCISSGALVESPPSADVVGSSIIGQTMDYVHGRAATDTAPSACSSGSTGPGAVWCLPSGMTFAHHPIFHSQPQCMDLCNPRVNPG
ncbi:hypothetical protein V8F44DRAFT_616772 [Aspergillus fumigatus]